MKRDADDAERRALANRQREQSRRQVPRTIKFDPEVNDLLDALKADTGLSLSDLIGEALRGSAGRLRRKYEGGKGEAG